MLYCAQFLIYGEHLNNQEKSEMKTTALAVLALAVTFALAPTAFADSFTYTSTFPGGISFWGTLTGDPIGGGGFDITSGTINLIDLANPGIDGSGDMVPILPNGNFYTGGGTILTFSPGWDTDLYPGQDPQIDANGAFTFDLTSGPGSGNGVYLGSNGADDYQTFVGNWAIVDWSGGTFDAVAAPTPEPASLIMMGTGLCLIAGLLKRINKSRKT